MSLNVEYPEHLLTYEAVAGAYPEIDIDQVVIRYVGDSAVLREWPGSELPDITRLEQAMFQIEKTARINEIVRSRDSYSDYAEFALALNRATTATTWDQLL